MLPRLRKNHSSVLTIEDEGPADSAAAGGGDTPTEPPSETPGSPTGEEMIPKSEVESIVKRRLERDRRSRKAKASPQKQPVNGEPTVADLLAKMDHQEKRHRFDRVAFRHGIDEETADDLFTLWDKRGGGDPADKFVSEKLARWNPTEPNPTENGEKPADDPPVETPAVTLPPTPRKVQKLDSGELIDVFELNEEELTRLGHRGVRREFERVLDEAQSRSGAPPLPAVLRQKG